MADNVVITSGANSTPPDGTTIATDSVGGVQYQVVKLDVGGDGVSVPVTGTLPVSGTVTISDGSGPVTVDGTVAITAASLPLPTGAATDTLQNAEAVLIGALNEAAPATDTASSGLNGRLQRIAQRLTSLIGLLPASLGQKASAASLAVVVASDQSAIPASQSGTWTVQPGNTANTTAWKVDASSVAVPVTDNSGSLTVDASTAAPLPVYEYDVDLALQGGMTSLRDMLVAQRYTVLADSVADGLAPFWTQAVSNGGTITLTTGEGVLATSTSTTGTAQMVSTNVTYYPGQVSWLNSAIRLGDTGSAGNVRRWGAFTVIGNTPNDGFYYELSGTTLNAVSVKAGTATAVASTSWTKFATNPFTLDTSYHSFEIRWTSNSVWFYIDNVLRHTASGGTSPITQTLNFPMALQTVNTSGATDRQIAVRNIGIGRFGTPDKFLATSEAADTSSVLPTVGVVGGWDGLNVRSAFIQAIDGHNNLFVHDPLLRRLLEEMLIEQRLTNLQLSLMLGPNAPKQGELVADMRLIH